MPKNDIDTEVKEPLPMGWASLPPDCEVINGKVIRLWKRRNWNGPNGEMQVTITRRPVALTMDEARINRTDYYDPIRGWLLEGWKWQSEPIDMGLDPFTGQRLPHYMQPIEAEFTMRGVE